MCCRVSVRTKSATWVERSVQVSRGPQIPQGGAGPRVSATAGRDVSWAPVLRLPTLTATALAAVAIQLAAQAPAPAYRFGWGDAATTAGAGVVALLPAAVRLPSLPPPCAPCDPAGLWSVDRRVLGADSPSAGRAARAPSSRDPQRRPPVRRRGRRRGAAARGRPPFPDRRRRRRGAGERRRLARHATPPDGAVNVAP